jgi:hypothetical protein
VLPIKSPGRPMAGRYFRQTIRMVGANRSALPRQIYFENIEKLTGKTFLS